ncbi:MAG: metallophosphoesterase [Candidatus Promineifilaceae bacterium]|jgi:predicted MPP superfamily phosphohydrolase
MIEDQLIYSGPRDRLARGRLHKVMVTLNAPVRWPAWQILLLALLLGLLAGLFWYFPQGDSETAVGIAVLLGLFFLGDIVILSFLPPRRISFGSWKAQFFPLALPRTLAAVGIGILSFWLPQTWAFGMFLAVQLLASVLLIWGAHVEPASLNLTHLNVTSVKIPPDWKPMRILHISDLHIERFSLREEMILDYMDEQQPDIILITGDYLNLSFNLDPEAYFQAQQFLSLLSAPQGVYAVLGTPTVDLWELIEPLFEELPITLLRDQRFEVQWPDSRRLTLLGLDCTHNIEQDAQRLAELAAGAPQSVPEVLLYHSPELMPQAVELGIDLYLCGHTHGGQVRVPVIGPLLTSSDLGRDYVMGHYQAGQTDLYVSAGVGLEGLSAPRVRLLAPPEITLLTLRPQ